MRADKQKRARTCTRDLSIDLCAGKITAVHRNEHCKTTYSILYDDGDDEKGIDRRNIKGKESRYDFMSGRSISTFVNDYLQQSAAAIYCRGASDFFLVEFFYEFPSLLERREERHHVC